MTGDVAPSDRLRALRRKAGLTQVELAELSGVGYGTVRKIEQGGTSRIETYHALARALGVSTSRLFTAGPPEASDEREIAEASLVKLRQAIRPTSSLLGESFSGDVHEELDLSQIKTALLDAAGLYRSNSYTQLARILPGLIESTHIAVQNLSGDDQLEALSTRSDLLHFAAKYLIQVRAHDLADSTLSDAINDAALANETQSAVVATLSRTWVLMRQGRLDEAEWLATRTADDVEPKISRANPAELTTWGQSLLWGASAASRNNRPDAAAEMVRLARSASAVLGVERTDPVRGNAFGPLTVAAQDVENAIVAGKADKALDLSRNLPLQAGRMSLMHWNRHRLDVAYAHTLMRESDEVTRILADMRTHSSEWLRHQRFARDIFRKSLKLRKRTLTREQRDLAGFLSVDG